MFCSSCGQHLAIGSYFCPNCGTAIAGQPTVPASKACFECGGSGVIPGNATRCPKCKGMESTTIARCHTAARAACSARSVAPATARAGYEGEAKSLAAGQRVKLTRDHAESRVFPVSVTNADGH
jgi:RNA polymerase subunit RPABC4/transcription elongation factor Spt4